MPQVRICCYTLSAGGMNASRAINDLLVCSADPALGTLRLDRLCHDEPSNEYATAYAMEGMAEDELDILDVEEAILNGQVIRTAKGDPRGAKYVVEGTAVDRKTPVGVVGRFTETGRYLIVTVYEITT